MIKGTRNTGQDLTGKTFGKLTVIRRIRTDAKGRCHWLCECECGNEASSVTGNLVHGKKQSCGCLKPAGRFYKI